MKTTVQQVFAEFEASPNFHIGFLWKTRINFFKLKQYDVAKKAGIAPATLSNIITGASIPRGETITAVESAITELSRGK